jgi:hypothetical protein
MHLGLFGCLTRLDAKWAKLEQKFVPWSRVEIFCNERTRSTLLEPKLMFWRILYYLGVFGTIRSPYETRCKKGRTSTKSLFPRSRVEIFRNERTRSTPLHPKLMFWRISNNLGAFWIIWFAYATRCKTGRTSGKIRATKSRRNFKQRTHLFHPIGP